MPDPGSCLDDGKQHFVQPRLAASHLELGLAGDVVQTAAKGIQDRIIGEADGQDDRHSQGDPQDRDQAPDRIGGEASPHHQADQRQEAHGNRRRQRPVRRYGATTVRQ